MRKDVSELIRIARHKDGEKPKQSVDIEKKVAGERGKKKVVKKEKLKEKDKYNYRYEIDVKGNANGRGCHLCADCIEKAIKTKALNRNFKTIVPDEVYINLAKHWYTVYTKK